MLKNHVDLFDTMKIFDDLAYSSNKATVTDYKAEADESGLSLSIDLPGVKLNDLSVTVTGREVKVSGKRRDRDFSYVYRISRDYDGDSSTASLEDGVLTLRFPKSATAKSKVISVKQPG